MKNKSNLTKLVQDMIKDNNLDTIDVYEIAQQWMKVADDDASGTLDRKEFFDFFSKVDGIN